MNDTIPQLISDLVLANHILANENVLDAFGHVSVRHPGDPDHFFLSGSRAPELVSHDDIIEFGSSSEPVVQRDQALYIERFIHGEIYRLRPDVQAICHHHAPAIMPFCISGRAVVPVYQHGAMLGQFVPLWDSRSEFGDTNLLVVDMVQGASLARTLGPYSMVLMRHHGATVIGNSLKELVFRAIAACRNAGFQLAASGFGSVEGLTPGEIEKASKVSPGAIDRAWMQYESRLPVRRF